MTTTTITANGTLGGHELKDITVLNPGGWFGKTWLVEIGGSYDPMFFVVEADSAQDALDEFCDNEEYGHLIHIDLSGSEAADYGYEAHPGDTIGGLDITEPCWVNLKGEIVTDPNVTRYLQEPCCLGNAGTPCDLDHVGLHGEFVCTYHGEGLPEAGVSPADYSDE